MTIEESYQFLLFLISAKQSGKLTPDSFNLLCQVVNLEYFNYQTGLPTDYQLGAPYAKLSWQITAKITDNNRHLVIETDIAKTGNYFLYPADYGAFSSLRFGYIYNPPHCANATTEWTLNEFVTDGELAVRLNDAILKPTLKRSISAYYMAGIRAYPEEVSTLHCTYLRKPIPPQRNFTVPPGTDQDLYNATGSRDWDWPETVHSDLVFRVAKYAAINIREENFYQMINQRIAAGQ